MNNNKLPDAVTKGIESIQQRLNDEEYLKKIEAWLGRKPDAFIASVMHLVTTNQELAVCEPESLCNAAAMAAQLNLPVSGNIQYIHIGPYADKRLSPQNKVIEVMVAQFQITWRGYIQLGERTGQYRRINVTDVREGELVSNDRLSGDCVFNWIDDEKARKVLPVIGYVSFFSLKSGFEKMLYWTKEQILDHAQTYSKTFSNPDFGWKKNEPDMCKKTMLKMLLSGYGPKSDYVAMAIAADQANIVSLDNNGVFSYPDNPLSDEPAKKEIDKRNDKAKKSVANVAALLDGSKTVKDVRRKRKPGQKAAK